MSTITVAGMDVQVNEMIDDSSMNATAADGSGRIFTKVGDVWSEAPVAMGGKRRKTKRKGGSRKKRRGGSKKRKSGKKRR